MPISIRWVLLGWKDVTEVNSGAGIIIKGGHIMVRKLILTHVSPLWGSKVGVGFAARPLGGRIQETTITI